ncbi:hypothetical protein GQ457_17G021010 [Hibiscus cannabinus]
MLLFQGNATVFSSAKSLFDFSDTPAAGPRDNGRNGSDLVVVVDEANGSCSFSVTKSDPLLLVNRAANNPTANNPKKIESRAFMGLRPFAGGSDGLEPSELETGRNGLVSTILSDEKKKKKKKRHGLRKSREEAWLSVFELLGSEYYIRAVPLLHFAQKLGSFDDSDLTGTKKMTKNKQKTEKSYLINLFTYISFLNKYYL